MEIEIFRTGYSQLQHEVYPIPLAKMWKNSSNTGTQDVLARFLVPFASIILNIPTAARTANSARFRPSRKWVAKITDYLRVPNESNIMTGANAATLGIGAPIQRRSNR